jgi:hypothetical protein
VKTLLRSAGCIDNHDQEICFAFFVRVSQIEICPDVLPPGTKGDEAREKG